MNIGRGRDLKVASAAVEEVRIFCPKCRMELATWDTVDGLVVNDSAATNDRLTVKCTDCEREYHVPRRVPGRMLGL